MKRQLFFVCFSSSFLFLSDRVSLKAPDTSSFTKNLSALIVRVAGAAVDGLFHVTAVGLISIVQIAVSSGGSGNESESSLCSTALELDAPNYSLYKIKSSSRRLKAWNHITHAQPGTSCSRMPSFGFQGKGKGRRCFDGITGLDPCLLLILLVDYITSSKQGRESAEGLTTTRLLDRALPGNSQLNKKRGSSDLSLPLWAFKQEFQRAKVKALYRGSFQRKGGA